MFEIKSLFSLRVIVFLHDLVSHSYSHSNGGLGGWDREGIGREEGGKKEGEMGRRRGRGEEGGECTNTVDYNLHLHKEIDSTFLFPNFLPSLEPGEDHMWPDYWNMVQPIVECGRVWWSMVEYGRVW